MSTAISQSIFHTAYQNISTNWKSLRTPCDNNLLQHLQNAAVLSPDSFFAEWEQNKTHVMEALHQLALLPKKNNAPLETSMRKILKNLFCCEERSLCKGDEFLTELAEKSCVENSPFLPAVCLRLLSLEDFEKWLIAKNKLVDSAIKQAENLVDQMPPRFSRSSRKTWKSEVKKTLGQCRIVTSSILNTFISVFVSWGEGRTPIGTYNTLAAFELIVRLLAIPLMMMMWLNTFVDQQWKAYVITGVVQIVALGILFIYRKINPMPEILPGCQNLTNRSECRITKKIIGRDDELMKLVEGIMDSGVNLQPIIVAPTRVGKSTLVEKLGQFVTSPEAEEPIKSLTIFTVTPSSLGSGFDSAVAEMRVLFDRVKSHGKKLVIVFDEIQESMKQYKWGQLSDFLKREMDGVAGIRCIAITTPEGYKTVAADQAFAERFRLIVPIDSLSEIETKLILQTYNWEKIKDVLVETKAIQKAIEITKIGSNCQPDKAQSVLTLACSKVRTSYSYYIPPTLCQKENELLSLKLEFSNKDLIDSDLAEKIKCLQNEILGLRDVQNKNRVMLKQIRDTVEKYLSEKKECLDLAEKIKRNPKLKEPQKIFLFQLFYKQQKRKEMISSLQEKISVQTTVDEKFIVEVFSKMKEGISATNPQEISPEEV